MWSQTVARVRAAWLSLGCSPGECLALAVLAAGAVAAVGVLWFAGGDAAPGRASGHEDPHAAAPRGHEHGERPLDDVHELELTESPLTVHVAGAVAAPGVVELPAHSRVADALEAAGGATDGAVLDAVNLARPLTDGEQLYIPDHMGSDESVHDTGDLVPAETSQGPSAVRPDGTLDLNRAQADDFEELPGVGPVLAERIVEHRDAVGGFTSLGDLRDVAGIGEVRFQELSELVSL